MNKSATNPVDRAAFCDRLRKRREQRELSLTDIAATTRIPLRSLEYLEQGRFDELPADVFVRGFLRSYASCVGLDADEIVRSYAGLGFEAAPVASDLANEVLAQMKVDEEKEAPAVGPKRRIARGTRGLRDGESPRDEGTSKATPRRRSGNEWLSRVKRTAPEAGSGADVVAVPAPRRRNESSRTRQAHAQTQSPAPSRKSHKKSPVRRPEPARRAPGGDAERHRAHGDDMPRLRVFLPRDFASDDEVDGRRGNLTFAVILLVIVATITMSYLMRRPSHAGDGVSQLDTRTSTSLLA